MSEQFWQVAVLSVCSLVILAGTAVTVRATRRMRAIVETARARGEAHAGKLARAEIENVAFRKLLSDMGLDVTFTYEPEDEHGLSAVRVDVQPRPGASATADGKEVRH